MTADPDLLPILLQPIVAGGALSVTAIGRREIWPLHRRAAELGGDLRTGLEDTNYLPDGARAASNGELVRAPGSPSPATPAAPSPRPTRRAAPSAFAAAILEESRPHDRAFVRRRQFA